MAQQRKQSGVSQRLSRPPAEVRLDATQLERLAKDGLEFRRDIEKRAAPMFVPTQHLNGRRDMTKGRSTEMMELLGEFYQQRHAIDADLALLRENQKSLDRLFTRYAILSDGLNESIFELQKKIHSEALSESSRVEFLSEK